MTYQDLRAAEASIVDKLPDLSKIKSPEKAAKTLYEHLKKVSAQMGQKPEIEVGIVAPGEREEAGDSWWVMWESGPHDWAINYTLDGRDRTYAETWYCEPYWGFDVIFVER